jgi:tetratricopeptide (TPR) repeat protein
MPKKEVKVLVEKDSKMAGKDKGTSGMAFFIVLASLLFLSNSAIAETRTEIYVRFFVEEYTDQASGYDSKVSCRVIALERVKRLLLEKWGMVLEGEMKARNFSLTKNKIIPLTAGLIRAEIIDEKWDGKTYYLKAGMGADPRDLIILIYNLRRDLNKTQELEETRKKADEAIEEVERLRRELGGPDAKEKNFVQYNRAINTLSAIDWMEKGFAWGIVGEQKEAIGAFTKVIELDPKNEKAFYNRGETYRNLGNLQLAIRDYDRAIELHPKDARLYGTRGIAYGSLGDHPQAIKDYDKAIELDPKDAEIYVARGISYRKLGNYQQSIQDYDQAIQLNFKDATVYFLRGLSYYNLGDCGQAIKDYDKAIELDPHYAMAYGARGMAYLKLGDQHKGFEELKIAARLGDEGAENYLKSEGIIR